MPIHLICALRTKNINICPQILSVRNYLSNIVKFVRQHFLQINWLTRNSVAAAGRQTKVNFERWPRQVNQIRLECSGMPGWDKILFHHPRQWVQGPVDHIFAVLASPKVSLPGKYPN